TIGERVRSTSPGRATRRVADQYSSKVQQRPLTATSTSYRPRPALAGTSDKRRGAPLVRDEEANAISLGSLRSRCLRPFRGFGAGAGGPRCPPAPPPGGRPACKPAP